MLKFCRRHFQHTSSSMALPLAFRWAISLSPAFVFPLPSHSLCERVCGVRAIPYFCTHISIDLVYSFAYLDRTLQKLRTHFLSEFINRERGKHTNKLNAYNRHRGRRKAIHCEQVQRNTLLRSLPKNNHYYYVWWAFFSISFFRIHFSGKMCFFYLLFISLNATGLN